MPVPLLRGELSNYTRIAYFALLRNYNHLRVCQELLLCLGSSGKFTVFFIYRSRGFAETNQRSFHLNETKHQQQCTSDTYHDANNPI